MEEQVIVVFLKIIGKVERPNISMHIYKEGGTIITCSKNIMCCGMGSNVTSKL
jgi:hypothetical protein